MACGCSNPYCGGCADLAPPPYRSRKNLRQEFEDLRIASGPRIDAIASSVGSSSSKGLGVHKLIVGVDFGTTYTGKVFGMVSAAFAYGIIGVSWVSTDGAHLKTLEDVHCIRDW